MTATHHQTLANTEEAAAVDNLGITGMAIEPRAVVQAWAKVIEHTLQQNDHKGAWMEQDEESLQQHLLVEWTELNEAIAEGHSLAHILAEAADVAALLMMLTQRIGALRLPDGLAVDGRGRALPSL